MNRSFYLQLFVSLVALATVTLLWVIPVQAQFNEQINYQGRLLDSTGSAVADGTYAMSFRLYTVATSGSAIWTETLSGASEVTVIDGLFSVMLGSTTPLSSVDFNQTLYLGVTIEADSEMAPRKILGAVPAAFVAKEANNANTVGGVASTSFLRNDQAGTVTASSSSSILSVIQNGLGKVASFFSGVTEVFTILNNGNVGIGTTTPTSRLAVAGNAVIGGNLTATGTLSVGTLNGLLLGTSGTVSAVATSGLNIAIGDTIGTLSATRGGTGLTTITQNQLLIGGVGNTWTQVATTTLGLATPFSNSAQLAALLSDETGSGNFVLSDSPAFTGTATFASTSNSGLLTVAGTTTLATSTIASSTIGTLNLTNALSIAMGGTGATTAAGARTNLGATTIGSNIFTLTNPSSSTLLRLNADNTVSAISTSTLNLDLLNTVGTLGATRGGTGLTSYATGDLIYASGANTLANRTIGSTGNVLSVVGGVPTWVSTSSLNIAGASLFTDGGATTYLTSLGENFGVGTTSSTSKLTVQGDSGSLDIFTVASSTGAPALRVLANSNVEMTGQLLTTGVSWTARAAAGNNDVWNAITYGNGHFVAVGDTGGTDKVITSPDGVNWTARSAAGDDDSWQGVTYGNGLFVAVGTAVSTDRVMTSPDGVNWTGRTAPAQNWQGVTYGNGLFVAVTNGGGSRAMTSPDGINWTLRSIPASGWVSVTYGNGLFVAVAPGSSSRVASSTDGITWASSVVAGDDDGLRSITYGNGLFVAVSNSGDRVITSPDATTWTVRSAAGNDDNWRSVTYGNGLFVAVSDTNDRIMTSPDGINWTVRTAPQSNTWVALTYGNSMFVAVSTNGTNRIMTSGFTSESRLATNNLYQGPTIFMNTLNIGTSTNNGTLSIQGQSGASNLFTIASSTGANLLTFTGTGNLGLGTSAPGSLLTVAGTAQITGTTTLATTSLTASVLDVTGSAGSNGMVLLTTGTTTRWVATSTLGISAGAGASTFLALTDTPSSFTANRLFFTNSGATAVTDSANLTFDGSQLATLNLAVTGTSTFSGTTTLATTTIGSLSLTNALGATSGGTGLTSYATGDLIYASGVNTLANRTIGSTGNVLSVVGGVPTWVATSSLGIGGGSFFTDGGATTYLTALNENFGVGTTSSTSKLTVQGDSGSLDILTVASSTGAPALRVMANSNVEITSQLIDRGVTWTARPAAGNDDSWRAITYGNGLFVAVGEIDDRVMTSSDGINWATTTATGNDDLWNGVTYGNGLFVAVGSGPDVVMTSPDGINWTARSAAGNDDGWYSVTYGNGLFVAVSPLGDRVMTSPDGINWTARSAAGNDDSWYSVTYGNGLFVAVGQGSDYVMTSPDGINWTVQSAVGNDDGWINVTYGKGLFVAVGNSNDRVMTSPDGINWTARSAAGNDDGWFSVTYGNGLFVAVGDGPDVVMTSPDGINWTARSAAGNDDAWNGVTYGNGMFVAVGLTPYNDLILTSGFVSESRLASNNLYQGPTTFMNTLNIGTSTNNGTLSIQGQSSASNLFTIASSTGANLLTFTGTGNLGLGTSAPGSLLTVAGTAQITGTTTLATTSLAAALLDFTGSAGTNGMVLLTTGTTTRWVATSTLGITGGGGSSLFTDSGATTYLTSVTDNLAIGTSTYSGSDELYVQGDIDIARNESYQINNVAVLRRYESPYFTDSNLYVGSSAPGLSTSSAFANVAVGFDALRSVTGGHTNVAVGFGAFDLLTTGYSSVAIGNLALEKMIGGANNTAVGARALNSAAAGDNSTAVGMEAGLNLATSSDNTVFGFQSGRGGAAGQDISNLTVLGTRAGQNILTGADNNILIGYQAADNLTTGANNIVIGYDVDIASTTHSNQLNIGNLIFGTGVDGTGTTLSSGNIGIGTTSPMAKLTVAGTFRATATSTLSTTTLTAALLDVGGNSGTNGMVLLSTGTSTRWAATSTLGISGGSSLFTDGGASTYLTSLTDNLLVGTTTGISRLTVDGSGYFSTGVNIADDQTYKINGANVLSLQNGPYIGYSNVYVGSVPSGASTTQAFGNTALGAATLGSLITGYENTAIGQFSLNNIDDDADNTAIGYSALNGLREGGSNSAIGRNAGTNLISGIRNLFGGDGAGFNMATGSEAVLLGTEAAHGGSTYEASRLIAIGYRAGYNMLTGANNNILIGHQAADNLTTGANNIVLGYDIDIASTTGSNQLNIGNLIFGTGVDGTGTTLSSGNIGIGTSSPSDKLTVAGTFRATGTSTLATTSLTAALLDFTGSAGTNGMVLQTTGTTTRWVATSTLGMSGGAGASTFLALTDTPSSFTSERVMYTNSGATALTDSANFLFDGSRLATLNLAVTGTSTFFGTTTMASTSISGTLQMGTTSLVSRFMLDVNNFSTAGIAGLNRYYTSTNAASGTVQFGELGYFKNSATATTTIVGSMFRIEDSSTLGNTVRGLEVQANRGTNTQGENTALSGFARTFGVRGFTSGDAGARFEPAGGYFETGGTTQGNAIRGYSSTITSANLLALFQDTSTFAGTGLNIDLGNGTGSFTGKFLDMKVAGASRFNVASTGTMFTQGDVSIVTTNTDPAANNVVGMYFGANGFASINRSANPAMNLGRSNDGAVLQFYSAGAVQGSVSIAGATVSYNAFTGSHFGLMPSSAATSTYEKGTLLELTGENEYYNDDATSEIVYGMQKTTTENSSRVIGTYLASLEPSQPQSTANPTLVMAVGNGHMWVADQGEDIKAGDYLISSNIAGHAEKDNSTSSVSYIIARASEDIDWSDVDEDVDGVKHKLITVFFENFTRPNVDFAMIASSTIGLADVPEDSFTDTFLTGLFAKITQWVGDAQNGIGDMYANVFNAGERICIDGECLTADDIRDLKDALQGGGSSNPPPAAPGDGGSGAGGGDTGGTGGDGSTGGDAGGTGGDGGGTGGGDTGGTGGDGSTGGETGSTGGDGGSGAGGGDTGGDTGGDGGGTGGDTGGGDTGGTGGDGGGV